MDEEPTLPYALQDLGPEYLRYLTDYEGPEEASCRDYVRCLLEQWISAVAGIAVVGPLWWFFSAGCRRSQPATVMRIMMQLIIRLAAAASWHQYPQLWFQLVRARQPRPLSAPVATLQSLIGVQLTRWTVATDLACLAATVAPSRFHLGLGYGVGMASVGLVALAARWVTPVSARNNESDDGDDNNKKQWKRSRVAQWRPAVKFLASAAVVVWILSRSLYWISALAQAATTAKTLSVEELVVYFPWRKVLNGLGVAVALLGPVCHLYAFRKLVRVLYTHNLSLALGTEGFQEALREAENDDTASSDKKEPKRLMQWRYKLTWREPERIRVTLDRWRGEFWYWLFLKGSVQEKLSKEAAGRFKSEVQSRGLTIWQRLAKERAQYPDAPLPDRTKWKENAMKRVAEWHQQDYDANTIIRKKKALFCFNQWSRQTLHRSHKQTHTLIATISFQDPLGIAVQQTFGIGLGFNFDHMSKDSDLSASRRLQTRAAKSAIKRAQEIYNAEAAREEVDRILDPADRDRRAAKRRQESDDEIQQMAKRLTELIPTDGCLAKPARIELYDAINFERISPNEYVMTQSPPVDIDSQALLNLLASRRNKTSTAAAYEIDYLNPMGNTTNSTGDDEFIEEWYNQHFLLQQQGRNSSSADENEDDQEDAVETFLV